MSMLSDQELNVVLSLIQLVALVLPANAILLQVLQEIYKKRYEVSTGEFIEEEAEVFPSAYRDYVLRSQASSQPDYVLAQWSIHLFVFSAFSFISSLILHFDVIPISILSASVMLQSGLVLIAVGFLFFGVAVLLTKPRIWKKPFQMIRDHLFG